LIIVNIVEGGGRVCMCRGNERCVPLKSGGNARRRGLPLLTHTHTLSHTHMIRKKDKKLMKEREVCVCVTQKTFFSQKLFFN